MNIDLHIGARALAMASMSWDRIAMSPVFRVEQFEPKVKKGSWYLTREGKVDGMIEKPVSMHMLVSLIEKQFWDTVSS